MSCAKLIENCAGQTVAGVFVTYCVHFCARMGSTRAFFRFGPVDAGRNRSAYKMRLIRVATVTVLVTVEEKSRRA